MDPRDARPLIAGAIEEDLTLYAVGVPAGELPGLFGRVSENYQALGIAILLASGEQARYRECLVRSAWARLHQLRCAGALQPPARSRATSFGEGLFDALAAGHWRLAHDIAEACPPGWIPEGEYEDDFCHVRLIGLYTGDSPPAPAAVQALLDRHAQVLDGARTPRLALGQALLDRDADAFSAAFEDFLREELEARMAERERLGEPDADAARVWMRGYVATEALALLRVAETAGIAPAGPHPLCPPGSLPAGPCPNFPDPFAEIEAAR